METWTKMTSVETSRACKMCTILDAMTASYKEDEMRRSHFNIVLVQLGQSLRLQDFDNLGLKRRYKSYKLPWPCYNK